MTRDEQIGIAADLFAKENSVLDKDPFPYGWGFQEGAKWADDHPGDNSHFKNTCVENIELRKTLEGLANRHEWIPLLGQCICKWHLKALELLRVNENV